MTMLNQTSWHPPGFLPHRAATEQQQNTKQPGGNQAHNIICTLYTHTSVAYPLPCADAAAAAAAAGCLSSRSSS